MKELLLLPMPPPRAGPEVMAEGVAGVLGRRKSSDTRIVNTTLRQRNREKGKFDIKGILAFLPVYFRYIQKLFGSDVVFMYFCSSRIGFLRDSVFILTAWVMRKKVIAQYHGGGFRQFYRRQPGIMQNFISFVLKRVDRILVLGDSLRSMMHGIVSKNTVDVLHNGIRLGDFPMKTEGGVSQYFTLFFLGHLTFPKGLYDLVIAYKQLYRRYAGSIRLLFAGERVGCKAELAMFLGADWRSFYLKNIDEIVDTIETFIDNAQDYNAEYLGVVDSDTRLKAMHQSDLFVLPSYTEGLSMSCIEAMSVGLPAIVTPVGAMAEIVKNGEGGLITPVGDPETLANNIEKLLLNREKAASMGRFNRKYVNENLRIEQVAERLEEIMVGVAEADV